MTLRRILRSAGSLQALAAPVLLVAGAAAARRLAWTELLTSRSLLCWLTLLSLALLARGAAAWSDRRFAVSLLSVAGGLLVAQGLVSALLTFDGTADAGEGEEAPPFTVAFAGRAARAPNLRAVSLPDRRDGPARLLVAGREVEVKAGVETSAGPGVAVRVVDVYAAPSFVVRRVTGTDEDAALLKIVPGRRDYFEASVLPHRFYVSMPERGGGDEVGVPEKLRLLVQRGKIRVFDAEVSRGVPIRFEGLSVAFAAGSRWAPIRIRSTPRPWLAAASGCVAAAAALLALARRRER